MKTDQKIVAILVSLILMTLSEALYPAEGVAAGKNYKSLNLTGVASWYSEKDKGVKKYTASGDVFEDSKKTCAS